jgi:hypothetical protein
MKNMLTGLMVIALLMPWTGAAGEEPAGADERQRIEQAARDYIEGWYAGDAERMERALHPDLVKRRVRALRSGQEVLSTISTDFMVRATADGGGKPSVREGQVNDVIVLDVSRASASVKTVSPEFVDYIHMAKVNGEWKIVNVLWEPVPRQPAQAPPPPVSD